MKCVKSDQNSVSPNSLFVLPNPQTEGSFMEFTSIPYKDYCTFCLVGVFFIAVLEFFVSQMCIAQNLEVVNSCSRTWEPTDKHPPDGMLLLTL